MHYESRDHETPNPMLCTQLQQYISRFTARGNRQLCKFACIGKSWFLGTDAL